MKNVGTDRSQHLLAVEPPRDISGLPEPHERDDQLVHQIREANEKLIVATVRAERLAEVAAESEERFRSLVFASSAIVWRANAHGDISFESDAWLDFTGVRLPQSIEASEPSHHWLDSVHPNDRERVHSLWRLAVATSSPYECEHRLLRKSGGYAWVTSRGVPILRDGVAREWIGMMTDVSERIEVELAREQFIAVLGHDLRSPLAAISISAQALRHLHLESPYVAIVEQIDNTSRRMASLVADVMDFAHGRLGNGVPLVRKLCDLRAVCAEIVADIERVHRDRTINFSAAGDLHGEWDAGRLAQVMTNLIANAVAHGQDPITLTLAGSADELLLQVSSRGPAIAAHVLARLFEPFARGDSSPTDGGLGLGLYIVSEIVKAHDGTIDVTSEIGATTFTVRIPRATEPFSGSSI
jgi:PAS domain S-box-containing protein